MTRRDVLAALSGGVYAVSSTARGARAAEAAQVTIDNFTFSPARLSVAAGARVTWINRDDIPHTVTSRDEPRVLRSPPLDTGDAYAVTLEKPGEYHYFCALHPHMQGTVIVR